MPVLSSVFEYPYAKSSTTFQNSVGSSYMARRRSVQFQSQGFHFLGYLGLLSTGTAAHSGRSIEGINELSSPAQALGSWVRIPLKA
jgi:hypothetical protein